MTLGRRLAQKSTWLIGGRSIADGLSFVFYLLLARAYGVEGIGAYAFAFAVAVLAGLVVGLGLRNLLTRDAAREPELVGPGAVSVAAIQAGLAIVLGAAIWIGASVLDMREGTRLLVVLAFASIALQQIAGSFLAYVEGAEAMETSATLEVLARAVQFVLGVGLILAGASLAAVVSAHVVAGLAHLLGAWWSTRRLFGPMALQVDPRLAYRKVHAALPFLASTVLYTLYARVDIVMLHHFRGEAETGLYSAAYKLVSTPGFVAFLVGVAIYPALARSVFADVERRDALFLGSLRWIAILGVAGAALFLTVGDRLTVLLFGAEFAVSGGLVRWMAGIFLAEFVVVPYWRLLYAMNRERQVLSMRAVAVGVNVVLNLVLIPRWGAAGAVWASLVSEAGLAMAFHLRCARLVEAPYVRRAGRLLLAGGAATLSGAALRPFVPWGLLLAIVPSLLLAFSLGLGVVKRADGRMLRNAFGSVTR